MLVYKLTDENDQSYGGTQWGENVTHEAIGSGMEFCSGDLIHVYSHPLLAVLLNVIHANFRTPHLWKAEAEVVASDYGVKLGVKQCTTLMRITPPEVTLEQRLIFGIICALEVSEDVVWQRWAKGWLDGTDRTLQAALAAREATSAEEAWAANWAVGLTRAAEDKAARAAEARAAEDKATWEAAWEAEAAMAEREVERTAAWAAVWAAEAATSKRGNPLDLIALAKKACGKDKSDAT